MTEIRYVAEIDQPGQPYTGPALLGTLRVTVWADRIENDGCVSAWTSDGWHNTGLLRAVDHN